MHNLIIPYYTLVDTNGSLLSAPKGYDLDVSNFVEFLDNGLMEFENRTSVMEIVGDSGFEFSSAN